MRHTSCKDVLAAVIVATYSLHLFPVEVKGEKPPPTHAVMWLQTLQWIDQKHRPMQVLIGFKTCAENVDNQFTKSTFNDSRTLCAMSSSIASRRRQLQVRVWEARSNFCKENNIPELGDWRGKCHRIGTDCSSLEAPIMSMQMMGLYEQ